MNQAMMKLAEKLGIDHDKMPREELAKVVCEKALKCIETFEGTRAIDALQIEPNVDYIGINLEQLQSDIDSAIAAELITHEQLHAFCELSDKAGSTITQLYASIEDIAPHKTIGITQGAPSIWRGGLGKVVTSMMDNRNLFMHALSKTTRQIRAHLKRRDAIAAAAAKDAHEKSGMHDQLGMGI